MNFINVEFIWIPREVNEQADGLARQAADNFDFSKKRK